MMMTMMYTSIAFMEKLTEIQPLHERRQTKVILQANNYKFHPDHPMRNMLEGFTKNRLKRSSFVHEAKKLNREYASELNVQTIPLGREYKLKRCSNKECCKQCRYVMFQPMTCLQ